MTRHYMTRCLTVSAAMLMFASTLCVPVQASDAPFKECTPLDDKDFELDTEKWQITRSGSGKTLQFKQIDRKRLRELAGYCNTKNGRYRFKTLTYGLTLQFQENNVTITKRFRCEETEDATPAGLECGREVRTLDWTAPERFQNKYH